MELTLVHALILTDYEATLPAQSFEALLVEDYPLHRVYNKATGEVIFEEYPFEGNPFEKISIIQKTLQVAHIPFSWSQEVVVS